MDHPFPKRFVEILNSGSLRDKHKFRGTGSDAGHVGFVCPKEEHFELNALIKIVNGSRRDGYMFSKQIVVQDSGVITVLLPKRHFGRDLVLGVGGPVSRLEERQTKSWLLSAKASRGTCHDIRRMAEQSAAQTADESLQLSRGICQRRLQRRTSASPQTKAIWRPDKILVTNGAVLGLIR